MRKDNSDLLGWAATPTPANAATETSATGPCFKVSLPTLAKTLGISVRHVNQLAVAGVVIKLDRGNYDLLASVENYIEKLRKPEAGVKERLTLAQAELAELKLQEARAELVPATQVELEWDSILRSLRSSIMGIPARVQSQLSHLTSHDVATLDRAIRDTLTELGNDNGNN
jgi:terminase small subunit / prophage DNA-packing protein